MLCSGVHMRPSVDTVRTEAEEKPSGSLWCYFFVRLPNASDDERTCLFACCIEAKILTFLLPRSDTVPD